MKLFFRVSKLAMPYCIWGDTMLNKWRFCVVNLLSACIFLRVSMFLILLFLFSLYMGLFGIDIFFTPFRKSIL